jgi:hypothetical protein
MKGRKLGWLLRLGIDTRMFYECHETLALIGWGLRLDGMTRDWF